MFTRKLFFIAVATITVAAAFGPTWALNRGTHKVPVAFSLSCDASTAQADRTFYPRSAGAGFNVGPLECVDSKARVAGVKPSDVLVYHDDATDTFGVIIGLKRADARALQKATATISPKSRGRRVVIGVGGSIVASGFLFAPFSGSEFFISAASHEEARKLAWLFVESIDGTAVDHPLKENDKTGG